MSDALANTGKILIYQNEKGDTKVDVYFAEDTIWMTQRSKAQLVRISYKFKLKEPGRFAARQNSITLI